MDPLKSSFVVQQSKQSIPRQIRIGSSIGVAFFLLFALLGTVQGLSAHSRAMRPSTRAIVDTEAPSTPMSLTESGLSQVAVTLTWGAASDDVAVIGYRLYEQIRINQFVDRWVLRRDSISATTTSMTGLGSGSVHRYAVTAFDAAGNESTKSAILAIQTLQPPKAYHPVHPGESVVGVVGQPFSYQVLALGVPAPTFSLAAGPLGMSVNPLTGLVLWTPAAADEGPVTATVRAINSQGIDDHTFSFTVHPSGTDLEAPGAISNLAAQAITTNGCTLTWDSATDNVGVAGYRILAQKDGHGNNLFIAGNSVGGGTAFVVTTLEADSGYRLWVAAYDAVGNVASISGVTPVHITTLPVINETAISGLTAQNDSPTELHMATHFSATVETGTNVSFVWDFGDGVAATGAVVSHTFASAGSFIVSATASNATSIKVVTTVVSITQSVPISGVELSITPTMPTSSDPISITVAGKHVTSCTPQYDFHDITEHLIEIVSQPSDELICLPVETEWHYIVQVGPLAAGVYTITHELEDLLDTIQISVTDAITQMAPLIQHGEPENVPLSVIVDTMFSYTVQAMGIPAPTFTLLSGPDGMQIDAASGHLTWSPDSTMSGVIVATVLATNPVGSDQHSFKFLLQQEGEGSEFIFLPNVQRSE